MIFFIFTVLTVGAGSLIIEPSYRAESKLLIKANRADLYSPGAHGENPGLVYQFNMERQKNSEIEIIKSRVLTDKVILALGAEVIYPELAKNSTTEKEESKNGVTESEGLFSFLPLSELPKLPELPEWLSLSPQKEESPKDTAKAKLRKDLEVSHRKNSNVITVSLDHKDPVIAAKVVETLITLYMERHLEVHTRNKALDFFKNQSALLEKALKQSENKLEVFKNQHRLTSPEKEQNLLLQQRAALQTDLNQTLVSERETENLISKVNKQLVNTDEMVQLDQAVSENNPLVVSKLEERLVKLELGEQRLKRKYTDEVPFRHKMLQQVREEIATVTLKLREQEIKKKETIRSGKNVVYLNLEQMLLKSEVDLRAFRTKKITQRGQLQDYLSKLKNFTQLEIQFNRLKQKVDLNTRNYNEYLVKFEKSRISNAMDT